MPEGEAERHGLRRKGQTTKRRMNCDEEEMSGE
jgi:hypothetical protein